MRKYLLLIAMLAIALAGCRVESNVILEINEDGSAVVGAEIGFDDEFRQLLEQSGASIDDVFGDLPQFGDGDVEPIERTEGDMTFIGAKGTVDDLSAYDMSDAQGDMFTSFSYTADDSTARLEASLSSADLGAGSEDFPFDPSQITDDFFSAHVVVKMPGTVTQSNADEVRSDGSLVWNIPLSGTKDISATSNLGGSSTNWLLIVLVIVLIVGVVAAMVATVVSRRGPQRAVQEAADSHRERMTEAPPSESSDAGGDAPVDDGGGGEAAATAEAPADEATDGHGETLIVDVQPTGDVAQPGEDEDQPDKT